MKNSSKFQNLENDRCELLCDCQYFVFGVIRSAWQKGEKFPISSLIVSMVVDDDDDGDDDDDDDDRDDDKKPKLDGIDSFFCLTRLFVGCNYMTVFIWHYYKMRRLREGLGITGPLIIINWTKNKVPQSQDTDTAIIIYGTFPPTPLSAPSHPLCFNQHLDPPLQCTISQDYSEIYLIEYWHFLVKFTSVMNTLFSCFNFLFAVPFH